jgi:hypothetical protein
LMVDSAASVLAYLVLAYQAEVCLVAAGPVGAGPVPACPALMESVLPAELTDDPAGFLPEACIPADCWVRTADDHSPDDRPDAAGDSHSAGNASCRHSPAGSPTRWDADGTMVAAGDTDFPIPSNSHGCNTRGDSPNSIPIHPIPRAGWKPSVHRW